LIGVDRNFDFAGVFDFAEVKKIEEIILYHAPDTPFSKRQVRYGILFTSYLPGI
jgi:hypothetical protein